MPKKNILTNDNNGGDEDFTKNSKKNKQKKPISSLKKNKGKKISIVMDSQLFPNIPPPLVATSNSEDNNNNNSKINLNKFVFSGDKELENCPIDISGDFKLEKQIGENSNGIISIKKEKSNIKSLIKSKRFNSSSSSSSSVLLSSSSSNSKNLEDQQKKQRKEEDFYQYSILCEFYLQDSIISNKKKILLHF